MIHNQAMLTVRIPRAGTCGIIEGHEIRALRGGDGTNPSTNQDLFDTGIVPSHGYLPAGVTFVPGSLVVR
jgi:hypothetical protein